LPILAAWIPGDREEAQADVGRLYPCPIGRLKKRTGRKKKKRKKILDRAPATGLTDGEVGAPKIEPSDKFILQKRTTLLSISRLNPDLIKEYEGEADSLADRKQKEEERIALLEQTSSLSEKPELFTRT